MELEVYRRPPHSDVHNYTRQNHLLHVNKSNINTYSNSCSNTSTHSHMEWSSVQNRGKHFII